MESKQFNFRYTSPTEEERKEYNQKQADYQREYRKTHPVQVAIWAQRTWERKLERLTGDAEI